MDLQTVPLDQLREHPDNPRSHFDPAQLAELADSIKAKGILNPLLVRPNGKKGFQVLAGARRLRAARGAGLAEVPVIVRELDDEAALEVLIVDNLQRADVHPFDEARGYQTLLTRPGYDVARIAERVGRSVAYIYDRVKLLNLTKEAQDLFLAGKFTAGHAVLLARLKPEDQKRALDPGGRRNGLFREEAGLPFSEEDEEMELSEEPGDPYHLLAPRSVRELKGWIAEYVKFDRDQVDPMLFPETAETLTAAHEASAKIIPITRSYLASDDVRQTGKERIYGERSWKRADGKEGSKQCGAEIRPTIGVVVCGDGWGEAFPVCIDKKRCKTHWASEIREAKKRAEGVTKSGKTGQDRYELEQQKYREQEAEKEAKRARWKKALPDILEAVAEKVKKAPVKANGFLADLVIGGLEHYSARSKDIQKLLSRGKTAEDLVRHAALIVLVSHAQDWNAPESFPKRAKAFGLDVKKILDEAAPAEKGVKEPTCRICGCTEDNACEMIDGEGCSWVEKDLCSNPKCVAKAGKPKKKAAK